MQKHHLARVPLLAALALMVAAPAAHAGHPSTIGIQVDKTAVEATAVAGSTVHFTIAVSNTGETSFVDYTFEDAACEEQLTGADADADDVLDPGETWTYSCAMATQVGQSSADNTARASATNADGKCATDEGSASIPLTQPESPPESPPETPGGGTPSSGGTTPTGATTPAGTTPTGGTQPASIPSGRARLRGPGGCVDQAFRARVRGRSIAGVVFFVDRKLVKKLSGERRSYSVKIRPGRYGVGRHRVVARVRFVRGSGTRARKLTLTFRRCAKAAVAPRFTG